MVRAISVWERSGLADPFLSFRSFQDIKEVISSKSYISEAHRVIEESPTPRCGFRPSWAMNTQHSGNDGMPFVAWL